MIGLYRPGTSALHRWPVPLKLATLLIFSTAVAVRPNWPVLAAGVVLVAAGYLGAGLGLRTLVAQVRPLRWWVALIAAFQGVLLGWTAPAAAATVRIGGPLVLAVAAAALLTLTTSMPALLDTLVAALRPLRRFRVSPERVGLVLLLAVRSVPVIAELAQQAAQARRARGLEHSPRALLLPLLLRTLQHADRLGEGLAARGMDDD